MSDSKPIPETQGVLVERDEPQVAVPPKYAVVLLNDDYTPMDFVVDVLQHLFAMTSDRATVVMLEVHEKGRAVCGVYSRDLSESKSLQVNQYAREHQQPLQSIIEKV